MTLALDLKSSRLPTLVLPLKSRDLGAWREALAAQWGPGTFDGEALLLDARALPPADAAQPPLAWADLAALLRLHGVQVLGLLGAEQLAESERLAAQAAGLALLAGGVEAGAALSRAEARTEPVAAPQQQAAPCLVIDRPLRSGQKVYARDADLVVLGLVSHGAEVIADGHIHVYGALRGRAVAGARGRADARIYAQSMEAELLSIAGTFRTSEKPLPPEVLAKAAQVRLDGERLVFEPLKY